MARILGVDLPRNKVIRVALRGLYGVGPTIAKQVLGKASVELDKNSNNLSDEEIQRIRQVLGDYKIEGDLRKEVGLNIKRLRDIGTYRGARHRRGLPVRGQRTHTNARTRKGKAVAIAGKKSVKQLK